MIDTDPNIHQPTHSPVESAPTSYPAAPSEPVLGAAPPARNAGLSLVAAFRAARIQQRPALQTGLRASRQGLRQERLARLGKPVALPAKAVEAPVSAAGASAPREEMAPDPCAGQSVFARFVDGAQAAAPTIMATKPAPASSPAQPAEIPPAEPLLAEPAPSEPAPAEAPPTAPPLSAIGFGPGMVIRFRQLGIETAADLAAADADSLRTALGDITRLINVDIWIASAQKACSAP
jgi:predicted flap endonuclease-1-like 5' DNA nuclease